MHKYTVRILVEGCNGSEGPFYKTCRGRNLEAAKEVAVDFYYAGYLDIGEDYFAVITKVDVKRAGRNHRWHNIKDISDVL